MAQIKSNWTAPTFSFDAADQPTAWEDFSIRALDYLETLRIKADVEDQDMKGWSEIKMMFTGADRRALKTLVDNGTITEADQRTPRLALKAIQTAIKEGEHYWHYRDEVLSDLRQQPDEQVHTLSTRIINLVNNCNFQDQQTTETIKIMLLQHAIRYHEARDWIRLQDPSTLTYKTLLQHCRQLEQRCEQFRKAQQKGRAELTTLANASVTQTSIHQDAITSHPSHNTCYRCGYDHHNRECPAIGQRCHNCNGLNHFTALCKSRHTNSYNYNRHHRYSRREHHKSRHSSRSRHNSRSSSRSPSRSPARSSTQHSRPRRYRSPTPHHIDTITFTRPSTALTNNDIEEDIEDNQTQIKKCKDRQPTPLPPTNVFADVTFSDPEDAPDTTSEASFSIHSQDESIDYNADYLHTSPKRPFTRPSHITATNNPQEESDSPISDTETESSYTLQTENTKFSSFQDHTAYITRPSAYSQSITILEDEVTSTPTRPRPIPLPRPSKATRAKQINKQPTPIHPNPTPDVKPQQKSPLLPTPPAPARNFNCNNHYNQHIPGPTSRYSTYPTFTRPSPFYSTYPTFSGPANYRYYRSHQQHPHQQHHISRPHAARFHNQRPPLLPGPSDQHQNFMTGPYQQHQHFPQQVFHIHISLPYTG